MLWWFAGWPPSMTPRRSRGRFSSPSLDGEPVAAASLSDGRTVANPFLPTADVVALLSMRARQLRRRDTPRLPATDRLRWRAPRLRAA